MAVRQKAMATLPKLIRSMRKEVPKQHNMILPSLRRAFSIYDQINLIDNVPEVQLRFQEFDETGFTVNGVKYEACQSSGQFDQFQLLIIGCGRYNHPLNPQVHQFVKSIGMKLEAVDSKNAASTYNILNEDCGCCFASLWSYIVRNSTPLEYYKTDFEPLESIFIVETPTRSCLL